MYTGGDVSWTDLLAWMAARWSLSPSESYTHDGRTPPLVLFAWGFSRDANKKSAAAADPKTPRIVLTWLSARLRAQSAPNITQETRHLSDALIANPSLSTTEVNRLFERGKNTAGREAFVAGDSFHNVLRHPNLGKSYQDDILRNFLSDKNQLGDALRDGGHPKERLESIFREAARLVLVASQIQLSQKDITDISARWKTCHKEFAALCLHEPCWFKGHPTHLTMIELGAVALNIGQGAMLLLTHPQSTETMQEDVLSELNRPTGMPFAWEVVLAAATSVGPTTPVLISQICAARSAVAVAQQLPMSANEALAWGSLVLDVARREADPSDGAMLKASMERSEMMAHTIVKNADLKDRIVWTNSLVRTCLLSPDKEMRIIGMRGASLLRGGERETHEGGIRAGETLKQEAISQEREDRDTRAQSQKDAAAREDASDVLSGKKFKQHLSL